MMVRLFDRVFDVSRLVCSLMNVLDLTVTMRITIGPLYVRPIGDRVQVLIDLGCWSGGIGHFDCPDGGDCTPLLLWGDAEETSGQTWRAAGIVSDMHRLVRALACNENANDLAVERLGWQAWARFVIPTPKKRKSATLFFESRYDL